MNGYRKIPFNPDLVPLNAVETFPAKVKPIVMQVLHLGANILPTRDERMYLAVDVNSQVRALVTKRYEDLGDLFATWVDPLYKPGDPSANLDTMAHRNKFVEMTSGLSREQIQRGLAAVAPK